MEMRQLVLLDADTLEVGIVKFDVYDGMWKCHVCLAYVLR